MAYTLPTVLVEIGHKLEGAAESVALEESFSALDKVRRCAFCNHNIFERPPPMLLSDALTSSGFFVFDPPPDNETFFKPTKNIGSFPGFKVVGGAVLQGKLVSFPAVLLFNKAQNAMMVHASDAPIPALEAELYDSSFDNEHPWEDLICEASSRETVGWRREAAIASVNAGLEKTPWFVVNGGSANVLRYGVGPLLSLRSASNKSEFEQVTNAVAQLMRKLSVATRDEIDKAKTSRGVITSLLLEGLKVDDGPPLSSDELDKCAEICKRAVLTWVACIILHGAADDAFDVNGESVSEYNTALAHRPANESLYLDWSAKERAWVESVCSSNRSSDLQCFRDLGYTLHAVMDGLGRPYTTVQIADASDCGVARVTEAVVEALFSTCDVAAAKRLSVAADCVTLHTAISHAGSFLCDSQALLVASRDPDGRFAVVKMVGRNKRVDRVPLDLFSRLVLYPWVRVVRTVHSNPANLHIPPLY